MYHISGFARFFSIKRACINTIFKLLMWLTLRQEIINVGVRILFTHYLLSLNDPKNDQENTHVIAVSETHLEPSQHFSLGKFVPIRKDMEEKRKGGVA